MANNSDLDNEPIRTEPNANPPAETWRDWRFVRWIRESWPQALFVLWSLAFIPFVLWQTSQGIQKLYDKLPPYTEAVKTDQVLDVHSEQFHNFSAADKLAVQKRAIYQSTWSTAALFEVLLIAYTIHIWILVQNFWDTYKLHRKFARFRQVMSQGWYVLVVAVAFPLGLAVVPEFSTNFNQFKPELLSHIWLAILSNLIVILLTAELSTLYYSLDEDIPIKTFKEYVANFVERLFIDLRLKQLLVAIVLDVITFYFVSRLPSIRDALNFDDALVSLLIYVSIYAAFSSFGAMFTLATHERVKRAQALANDAGLKYEKEQ